MISDFVEYLLTEQLLKLSGVIETTVIRQKYTVQYLLRLKLHSTSETHGFNSLMFSNDALALMKNRINSILPRLTPCCYYVLFGGMVARFKIKQHLWENSFWAIGKCINLAQHRQNRETESSKNLTVDQQACLKEDEKHMSNFAKIHWKIKDTHSEKAPINKIPALTKCTSMGVWVVGTSNRCLGCWYIKSVFGLLVHQNVRVWVFGLLVHHGCLGCWYIMGVWVVGTSNRCLGCWYMKSALYKRFFNWNRIFKKIKSLLTKLCSLWLVHFVLTFLFVLTLASHIWVLYGNDVFSVFVLSAKKRYSSFKVKVLKTFKISTDCHMKTCWSLKRRAILKIRGTVFRKNLCSFCWL